LGGSLGRELLKVHVSYGPLLRVLLKKFNAPGRRGLTVKGMAHITGGGFTDNIPRVLPKNCDALVRKGSWETLPIFQLLAAGGGVAEEELYQVFNMGIGLAIVAAADQADALLRFIRREGTRAWIIGEIARGRGRTRMV
jgi:phosphoribosylformylglycinamidine cyclo-ligase